MGKFEEAMSKMELKKPPKEVWKLYWASVYYRLERRIGWILLSIGAITSMIMQSASEILAYGTAVIVESGH